MILNSFKNEGKIKSCLDVQITENNYPQIFVEKIAQGWSLARIKTGHFIFKRLIHQKVIVLNLYANSIAS